MAEPLQYPPTELPSGQNGFSIAGFLIGFGTGLLGSAFLLAFLSIPLWIAGYDAAFWVDVLWVAGLLVAAILPFLSAVAMGKDMGRRQAERKARRSPTYECMRCSLALINPDARCARCGYSTLVCPALT